MNYFSLHPNVYCTNNKHENLPDLLNELWSDSGKDDQFIIVSGFANYNGGVRFYDLFENHVKQGGRVTAILGASYSQRLTTVQVVKELLSRGVHVKLINRKRLLHAKLYGSFNDKTSIGLVVSSGNFTGPGMALNVEASFYADSDTLERMNFNWSYLLKEIERQSWQTYDIDNYDENAPYNDLLYDEEKHQRKYEKETEVDEFLITTLSHNDVSRIQEKKPGTQYIWLSKDTMGYFPPLTIRNKRGYKKTYSAKITINYPQLDLKEIASKVTFEMDNNMDFRFLTTANVNNTQVADEGDLALIVKIGDAEYDIYFISKSDGNEFIVLDSYATRYIGNKGKRYGFVPANIFEQKDGMDTLEIKNKTI